MRVRTFCFPLSGRGVPSASGRPPQARWRARGSVCAGCLMAPEASVRARQQAWSSVPAVVALCTLTRRVVSTHRGRRRGDCALRWYGRDGGSRRRRRAREARRTSPGSGSPARCPVHTRVAWETVVKESRARTGARAGLCKNPAQERAPDFGCGTSGRLLAALLVHA